MRAGRTWQQERELLRTAEMNLGLFTMTEWEAAGLTRDQLKARRRKGTIHRIFNGVFCLAAAPRTLEFAVRAGVLRSGPVAAGFGGTAAAKHGLMQAAAPTHIASTRTIENRNLAYRFHRVSLSPSEIVVVDGAPITDMRRTMLDVCGYMHPKRAITLYRRAKRLALITDEDAARKIEEEARQGRAGITLMRSLITEDLGDLTRLYSDLEIRFVEFLKRWNFPDPLRNIALDLGGPFPWRPDFFWPGPQPLAVEIDHHFTHAEEWERDREKEHVLEDHGITVFRVTNNMMDDEDKLARRLGKLLR